MERSSVPSLEKPSVPATDHCDESASEYNTADLSDLSGLSKVLRADDSIADRVRCLLEDDDGSENDEKPALLSSINGSVPADDEMKGKIESLLQDAKRDTRARMLVPDDAGGNVSAAAVRGTPTIKDRQTAETKAEEAELAENEGERQSPEIRAKGRPSGDGAACDSFPIVVVDSSDDIMNISDSTEYSDLPKVVDNPIKSASQPLMSSEEKKSDNSSAAFSISVDNGLAKINAEARFYADSEPNTSQHPDNADQMHDLEKYVGKRGVNRPSMQEEAQDTPVDIHRGTAMGPIHSTPYVSAPNMAHQDPRTLNLLQSSISTRPKPKDLQEHSQEANITVRSRPSNRSYGAESVEDISQQKPETRLGDIPKELEDEELLKKVRNAVSNGADKSSALKGPHTASERSIASTVDSLAMHVKNLLKGEEPGSRHSLESNPLDVNLNEVSQVSNYSEELSNFEKTNLWKYTRQFLPGAMIPSREIQPLERFCKPSPIRTKEISSDSSGSGSPETYRLAKRMSSSRQELGKISPLPAVSSNLAREDFRQHPTHVMRNTTGSRIHSHASDNSAAGHQSFTSRRDASSSLGKGSSSIIGRYDSYSKPTSYTPQNESYKPLEPEYSQTPFTPYLFVTPRKVAWEPEKEAAVAKHRSSYPRERVADRASAESTPTRDASFSQVEPATRSSFPEERSAYFGRRSQMDVEKSPKPLERSSVVRFQRLPSDHADSLRKRYLDEKDEGSESKELSMNASEDRIFVKPVTPPDPSRRDIPRLDRSRTWHGDTMDRDSPAKLPPQPSPESVHFRQTTSSRMRSNVGIPTRARSSPINREHSFTTPMASARPPQKNTTPNVQMEKPRPAKSLPTFDQLMAEGEKKTQAQLHSPKQSSSSEKFEVTLDKAAKSTPVQKSELDLKDADFAPLRPEVCLDESFEENADSRATARKISKEREENLSDDDLHRRTTRSRYSCSSDTDSPELPSEVDVTVDAEKNPKEGRCGSASSPPSSPAEPAPLPFVRLCKKKPAMFQKPKTGPLRSISTEKVQNLLKKEKCVKARQPTGNQVRETCCNLPATNGGYTSSDEDLLNLLETFSTKVPLMEKLLRKLYEKNVEKKSKLADQTDDAARNEKERHAVDQSVQTSNLKQRKSPARDRRRCDHAPSARPKCFADTSCQTSFVKQCRKPRVVHKSTSPMQDYTTETDEIYDANDSTEGYESSLCCVVKDKENSFSVRSKVPCSFFVDLTPEKLPKCQGNPDTQCRPLPVAWYEPYEYMPPWRPPKASKPCAALGFVDANIQNAFLNNKRDFVIRSWERQEDIAIRAEERKLRDLEEKIHDQIEALHKEKAIKTTRTGAVSSPKTIRKKDRVFGWKEMRKASRQKYESLPEVVAKKKEAERRRHYEVNRKRAEIYKRKITQLVVQKRREKLACEV